MVSYRSLLLLVDLAVPGVDIATFPAALIAAIAIGLLNSSIKPICQSLLPLNYSTLGLFSVVNGVCFWLAAVLVPGFSVHILAATRPSRLIVC